MNDKRGLSAIIITVIMIGLVLAAIAIVWVVVSGLIQDELSGVSGGVSKVILSVDKVYVDETNLKVKVTRNTEEADLAKINFQFSDGEDSVSLKKEVTLGPGDSQTIDIALSEIVGVGYIKEVSVAPILKLDNDDEKLYDFTDEYETKIEDMSLLVNPGFESGLSGWDKSSGVDAREIVSEGCYEGSKCLKLVPPSTTNNPWTYQDIAISPISNYRVSYFGKGDDIVVWVTNSQTPSTNLVVSTTIEHGDSWEIKSVDEFNSGSSTIARITFKTTGTASYIDNVVLQKIS